jgi:hypothetical protein
MELSPTPQRPEAAPREDPEGATVVGRLVTTDHIPVPEGWVELREGNPLGMAGASGLPRLGSHRTDVDALGNFALVGVPPVTELVVHAEGQTFAAREAGPYAVAAGQLLDLGDLVVLAGLLVHGTVLGADSPLTGRTSADLRFRERTQTLIMAIRREGVLLDHLDPLDPFRSGDTLYLVGSLQAIQEALKFLEERPPLSEKPIS